MLKRLVCVGSVGIFRSIVDLFVAEDIFNFFLIYINVNYYFDSHARIFATIVEKLILITIRSIPYLPPIILKINSLTIYKKKHFFSSIIYRIQSLFFLILCRVRWKGTVFLVLFVHNISKIFQTSKLTAASLKFSEYHKQNKHKTQTSKSYSTSYQGRNE